MGPDPDDKANAKQAERSSGGKKSPRRKALLLGALGLAVLGVILLIVLRGGDSSAEPSIPAGSVVVIEEAPSGMGEISERELQAQLASTAAAAGLDPPGPEDSHFGFIQKEVIERLIKEVWVAGQAEELDLGLSEQELAEEVEDAKDEEFGSKAEFEAALRKGHQTQADFEGAVERRVLSDRIQEWVEDHAPEPDEDEIEEAYEAYVEGFDASPEERAFRYVINKDWDKAERALELVDVDRYYNPRWGKAARLYSEDPETKDRGGGDRVRRGELPDSLDELVFSADPGEGPPDEVIDIEDGFVVFELGPVYEAVQPPSLEEMEPRIRKSLDSRLTNEYISEFSVDHSERWSSRTFCAPRYVVELCSNSVDKASDTGR